ncbi:PIG-L deacetylase family protein [Peribacillus glennii]|uniref:PIG-L family deacetylase n=1 Tax=Peribacillus glennii TaxID=2303991 RepID=A0A372LEK2_9BACI|nr:PIG-L family deacetylase [Peribacillus glennii]RFU64735.1 PIG-L family deacetylase [Peribacillus glennii]
MLKRLFTRRHLPKLLNLIPWSEQIIKKIEIKRGLYQYPDKMLGRKLPFYDNQDVNGEKTDVLVFAAHADDEILGLGATLYRHSQKRDNIKIVYTTNGSADWFGAQSWNIRADTSKKRAEKRYREGVKALSLLNIPKENIFCLGYPDGGTQRYLTNMSDDVKNLLQTFNPEKVYVHSVEGGHIDHDITSFVVKYTCEKIGYRNVFEWAEYHRKQPIGTKEIIFLPNPFTTIDETIIDISEEERNLKKIMLSCHISQDIEQFYTQGEAIRRANLSNLAIELYTYCKLPKFKLKSIVKRFTLTDKSPSNEREEVKEWKENF